METGVLIAIAFGVGVIALAVVLTRIVSHRRRDDINRSRADGRGAATWAGIRAAGFDESED